MIPAATQISRPQVREFSRTRRHWDLHPGIFTGAGSPLFSSGMTTTGGRGRGRHPDTGKGGRTGRQMVPRWDVKTVWEGQQQRHVDVSDDLEDSSSSQHSGSAEERGTLKHDASLSLCQSVWCVLVYIIVCWLGVSRSFPSCHTWMSGAKGCEHKWQHSQSGLQHILFKCENYNTSQEAVHSQSSSPTASGQQEQQQADKANESAVVTWQTICQANSFSLCWFPCTLKHIVEIWEKSIFDSSLSYHFNLSPPYYIFIALLHSDTLVLKRGSKILGWPCHYVYY